MNPLVSVIMPLYNYEKKVGRAIRSVLLQREESWELIIVDDASTDNSLNVAKSFSDLRIRVFQHVGRKGSDAALNTGMREAHGKYITTLDADDWLPEDSLSGRLCSIKEYEYIHAGLTLVYSSGELYVPPLPTNNIHLVSEFLAGAKRIYGININTVLFKRSLTNKIGYRSESHSMYGHNDYEYILRLLVTCEGSYIDKNVYYYSVGHPSLSSQTRDHTPSITLKRKFENKYLGMLLAKLSKTAK